jgi:hypothetical protein
LQHETAAVAQESSPATSRREFEFKRMIEVVQEARDYVQRRKELLGGLRSEVQPLVTEGQQRLQELKAAIQQRELRRARKAFHQALAVFDEIRLRLSEVLDAQNVAATTQQQAAMKLALTVTQPRSRLTELKQLASRSPVPAIDTELARIDGLIRTLENRSPGATAATLRPQLLEARQALEAVGVAIIDGMEAAP